MDKSTEILTEHSQLQTTLPTVSLRAETRLDVMKLAHARLQQHTNHQDLPNILYRTDLLPNFIDTTDQLEYEAIWDNAIVDVSYLEGFPSIELGYPIWHRLPFEPEVHFQCFQAYLDLPSEGRALYKLADDSDLHMELTELHEFFYTYYWPQRTLAYELYNNVIRKRKRAIEIETLESKHAQRAATLDQIAMDFIESEDCEDLMTPSTALKMLDMSTVLDRLAVGLPAKGPVRDVPKSTQSITVEQRSLQTKGTSDGMSDMRDAILSDENATRAAQELIIRMTQSNE